MNLDEIENSEEYNKIKQELEEKIDLKMRVLYGNDYKNKLGMCHYYWKIKKDVLLKDYNINWKSPDELNKDTIFD